MVTSEQLKEISVYVRGFLFESAERSEQDWLAEFPRAAAHRWQHTLIVLANADRILEGEGVDDERADAVRVAALLHDVSMFTCYHAVHGQVSAEMAQQYLMNRGYSPEFIARVCQAIAEHGTDLGDLPPEGQGARLSWEGKVLLEADILDKLGASAVTSTLLFLGKADHLNHEAHRALRDSAAFERAQFFRDFKWTDTGTRLAADRFSFFLEYLDRLREEVVEDDGPRFE